MDWLKHVFTSGETSSDYSVRHDGGSTAPTADELRASADRLSQLADELERIEQEVTADELTYQLRDGDVVIIELAYRLSKRQEYQS